MKIHIPYYYLCDEGGERPYTNDDDSPKYYINKTHAEKAAQKYDIECTYKRKTIVKECPPVVCTVTEEIAPVAEYLLKEIKNILNNKK